MFLNLFHCSAYWHVFHMEKKCLFNLIMLRVKSLGVLAQAHTIKCISFFQRYRFWQLQSKHQTY